MIDIANPQSPEIVGSVGTVGDAYGVVVSDTHAYVADWTFGLQAVDITNPQNPEMVGEVGMPWSAYDVAISGTHAYVAGQTAGLLVIDITDPQSPELVGGVSTQNAFGVAVSGTLACVADAAFVSSD